MKKIITLLLALCTLGVTAIGCSGGKKADYTVGILQVATHTALDNAREGFKDTLKEWAQEKGKTIEFDEQNALGDSQNETTLADKLVTSSPDILLGISTSSAQKLMGSTTKIPTLFTAVTDPEGAGLTAKNVTGTSDMAAVDKQIDLIKQLAPQCKKIGFVYCSKEDNSIAQVELAEAECTKLGISCERYPVTATNDIQTIVESISGVDAVYIPTDNLLAANMPAACDVLSSRGIPVVAGESGMCEDGEGTATLCIDYYKLGVQTARIAIKILEGKSPSEIPFEYYSHAYDLYINNNNAAIIYAKNSSLALSATDIENIKNSYNG